jgi:xanthine dehydrogenase accessory factor
VSEELLFPQLRAYLNRDEFIVLATVIRGPVELIGRKALIPANGEPVGPLLVGPWHDRLLSDAYQLMQPGIDPVVYRYDWDNLEVFFDIHRPAPKVIIIGAVHIAESLIRYAKPLGFRTIVVDPRGAFATTERFSQADELRHQWPDQALPELAINQETAVVLLTHDPKIDDPALKIALLSPAFYVGALGSQRTHIQRLERLQAEGIPQDQLDRIHAPVGLNLGGRTPAEIGLSVMAEIVAVRNRVLASG